MIVSLKIFAVSGLLNAVTALAYGLYVYIKRNKNSADTSWFFLLTVSIAVWGFSYWGWLSSPNAETSFFWIKLLTIGSLFIPLTYFHWVISLGSFKKLLSKIILFVSYLIICLNIIFINSAYVIQDISQQLYFPFWPQAGFLYTIAIIYLYLFIPIVSLIFVVYKTFHTSSAVERRKLFFIIVGTIIGFGSGLTNFPLWYGIPFPPYATFFNALFPLFLAYASVRHRLFDTKTIGAELLIMFMLIVLLIEIFLSEGLFEYIFRGVFFIIVLGFSYLLIKSINKEIENREKGERIARYLANANARLRELDKQKTEFVSIASHQLRSPIAAIKGYTSMITEESYGKVPEHLAEPLHRILESGQRISVMVDDFLNVTRIEQGRMTYDMRPHYVCDLINAVAQEQSVVIKEKGLSLKVECGEPKSIVVKADEGKLKQIFSNLLDNAIKYTQKGSITVSVERVEPEHKVLIKFKDTGIGIAREEISNLFQKFNRASNANEANVLGTGLGLYIAREIMKAHEGWIDVDSDGVGKGSTFTVELPACDEEPEGK